jgi:tetratricopeptide (TPR) repeat protein
MKRYLILILPLAALLLWALPQSSDNEVKLGIAAYKNNHYDEAIQHFEKAVELDPGNVTAQLYAATACVSQYIPGVGSEENVAFADRAVAHYQRVLDANATREQKLNSAKGIAYIDLNMKKWDEAKTYYQMASSIDPKDAESYYSMGVIDWTQCYSFRMEGRAKLGMAPDQHLSSKKPAQQKFCEEVQVKNMSLVEDGITNLEKAIELRAEYDDAMAYMNLMYRERADMECDDLGARQRDLKTADDWVDKALATKKAKAERNTISQ